MRFRHGWQFLWKNNLRAIQKWISNIVLRSSGSVRSLRNMPIVGELIHKISHRLLPASQKVWVRVEAGAAKGLWIELNPRTGQSYIQGDAEISIQKALFERLEPGMVFYDLGANIGLYTLIAARLVGGEGKVISFEPDRENAERLRRNVKRNHFLNVTIVEAGVWSSSGDFSFIAADAESPDRGVGTFVPYDNGLPGIPVRCVSLDDYTRSAPGPHVLKCDVEGAEIEVLLGAKHLLRRKRPLIICELHSENSRRVITQMLKSLEYTVEEIDENHVLFSP